MHQIWIKEDIYSNAYHNMTNEATWLHLSTHVLKIRWINHVWYVLFVLIQFQFFILVLTTKICPYDHPQISTYYEICYPFLTSIYMYCLYVLCNTYILVNSNTKNIWCSDNSVLFKSSSISGTFKFCAVRIALCALEHHSTDSLGTQHRAKFESNTKGMTFETNAICTTSDIQAHIYK